MGHRRSPLHYLKVPVAAALLIVVAGCASMQRNEAAGTEQLLAAAGFHVQLADTPKKVAQVKALPQHRLFPQMRDGKLYYVYADSSLCACIYIGTEKNYQQFERLAVKERIAEDQRVAAQMNANAAMDWSMWGPWGPPWY